MKNYFNIAFVGNVTRDFEVKELSKKDGTMFKVVNLNVVVNNGEGKSPTYFNCTFYGEDNCSYLERTAKKGTQVLISGNRLTLNEYEYNGEIRRSYEVNGQTVECLNRTKQSVGAAQQEMVSDSVEISEEDLSFEKEETVPVFEGEGDYDY